MHILCIQPYITSRGPPGVSTVRTDTSGRLPSEHSLLLLRYWCVLNWEGGHLNSSSSSARTSREKAAWAPPNSPDFQYVVRQTEQQPLSRNFSQPTLEELAEAAGALDLTKHRFHDALAGRVPALPCYAPQVLRHPSLDGQSRSIIVSHLSRVIAVVSLPAGGNGWV